MMSPSWQLNLKRAEVGGRGGTTNARGDESIAGDVRLHSPSLPAGGSGIDVLIARADLFGVLVRVLRVILDVFPEFSLGSASRMHGRRRGLFRGPALGPAFPEQGQTLYHCWSTPRRPSSC